MFHTKTMLALSAAGLLFVSAANAADGGTKTNPSNTADMKVTLTVQAACKLDVGSMDFGPHGSNEGQLDTKADATITCTNGVDYTLLVDAQHDYIMKSEAGKTVAYTLYSDNGYSKQLNDTSGLGGTGTGKAESVPIYGRVTAAALQAAPEGRYEDTVTFVVRY